MVKKVFLVKRAMPVKNAIPVTVYFACVKKRINKKENRYILNFK